ncbi:MAG: tRNA lysidine(34) synthetase TilS [Chloroflexi bacterium]|nr:tRNA lysidine(34) synthetase TilS [Chloroflexota bacterium]
MIGLKTKMEPQGLQRKLTESSVFVHSNDKKVISKVRRAIKSAIVQAELTGKYLVVGISGGPDSVSLLDGLVSLRDELNLTLHAAHLNHGLRSEAAKKDADFVAKLSEVYGVSHTPGYVDVPKLRRQQKLSVEEAARLARYDFLGRVTADLNADAIVLGHTASDQAETVLLNIIRGTGLSGLRGMEMISQRTFSGHSNRLFRPLLKLSRKEILDYCEARNLEPRWDETNASEELARGRLRQVLLPELEQLNPSVEKALVRLSENVSRDLLFIEEQTESFWKKTTQVHNQSVLITRKIFASLSQTLQMGILRKAVATVKGNLDDLEQNHIESMARLICGPVGRSLDLPGGVSFSVGYQSATLSIGSDLCSASPKLEGKNPLSAQGVTQIGQWKFHADVCSLGQGSSFSDRSEAFPDGLTARFSLRLLSTPLFVRSRERGEYFQPLGMSGHKKLQDFMVDSKIPRRARQAVPLVVTPDDIVWVVGWRIADWAKVRQEDSECLEIRAEFVS